MKRDRLFVGPALCLPDEFGEVLVPKKVQSVGRIQRCERFPATSKFSRWKHSSRSCPCGLISAPLPSKLHFVARLLRLDRGRFVPRLRVTRVALRARSWTAAS